MGNLLDCNFSINSYLHLTIQHTDTWGWQHLAALLMSLPVFPLKLLTSVSAMLHLRGGEKKRAILYAMNWKGQ